MKIRLYPNEAQLDQIYQTGGCCRYVYNYMLGLKEDAYKTTGKSPSLTECTRLLPKMKSDKMTLWLREAESSALQQSIRHLFTAYDRFFQHQGGYPNYKSKKQKLSYTCMNNCNNIQIVDKKHVKLPKLGIVKAVIHRKPPKNGRITSVTISQEKDGTCYASLLFEVPERTVTPVQMTEENTIGLDFKVDGLYVDSNGKTYGSPKSFQKSAERLAKEQKRMAKKQGGAKGMKPSNNYLKQQQRIAKIHHHIRNQRTDYTNKAAHAIAKRYCFACIEDLSIRDMTRHKTKAKRAMNRAMLDNGWQSFTVKLDRKLREKGGRLIKVGRYFPSSQLCSSCGMKNPKVKDLHIRKWTCPHCGQVHDRDINAAINIKTEGMRIS